MLDKATTMLTEATEAVAEKGDTAKEIVNFFQSDGMKATGYILAATAVVVIVCVIAWIGFKKAAQKYGRR